MKPDPNIIIYNEPDRLEKIVRLVCGGLFGAVGGFFLVLRFWPQSILSIALITVFISATCAVLAMHYGDHFWHRLGEIFRWIP